MLAAVMTLIGLLYASQLPLCVAVVIEYSGTVRIGMGLGAFSPRHARRRALRHMKFPRKKPETRMEKTGWFGRALHGTKYLYAHCLMLRISIDGEIGGTDAARIAVSWGAAQALLDTLCALTDGEISGSLRPDFSAPHTRATLRLTYAAKGGAFVMAALQVLGEQISGKVKPWTSTPLKA